jgi:hypothetical protein
MTSLINNTIKNFTGWDKSNVYIFNKENIDDNFFYIRLKNYRQEKYCGVYWLYDGEEIVYIGYSTNLITRIKSHICMSSNKKWDKVKCVNIGDKRLSKALEFSLLRNIDTRYNNKLAVDKIGVESSFKRFRGVFDFWFEIYEDKKNGIGAYKEFYSRLKECNIETYLKHKAVTFKEFSDNFNRMVRGEKFNKVIIRCW